MGGHICDFCCGPEPRWLYPARDFITTDDPEGILSTGAWAACGVCHGLIEAGDKQGLAVQASTAPGLRAFSHARLVSDARAIHARFFANRTGPATGKEG
jgi:hypothetical protein